MEIVPSICLSSLAGAIFFFTGGRLSARAKAALEPAELGAERARSARIEEEAERAQAEAARAVAAERAAREEVERRAAAAACTIEEQRTRLTTHAEALSAEIAELRAAAMRGAGEIEKALAGAGELEKARANAATAERRAAALTTDLAKVRGELSRALDENRRVAARSAENDARLARAAESEARAADLERLRAENDALKAANAALSRERESAPDPAELQRRSVELSITARALTQRAEDMDRRDMEHAELRAKCEELALRAADADELRRRVAELEAQGFARRLEEPAPPSRPPPEGASLATILERELGKLVDREEGCRMAVLADPRGLLIAASASASYPHEVAAASSLTTYASDRLRELLPLGAPASLELYDDNGLCVRTRWLRFEDECLLVSTVGVVDPRDVEADLLRSRLGELIGS